MRFAVEAQGLTKRYRHGRSLTDILRGAPSRETAALTDVSLTIEEGEVFGLLGPNGSGKTTFLKMLSTILLPTSGAAKIFGRDVRQEPRKVRRPKVDRPRCANAEAVIRIASPAACGAGAGGVPSVDRSVVRTGSEARKALAGLPGLRLARRAKSLVRFCVRRRRHRPSATC